MTTNQNFKQAAISNYNKAMKPNVGWEATQGFCSVATVQLLFHIVEILEQNIESEEDRQRKERLKAYYENPVLEELLRLVNIGKLDEMTLWRMRDSLYYAPYTPVVQSVDEFRSELALKNGGRVREIVGVGELTIRRLKEAFFGEDKDAKDSSS